MGRLMSLFWDDEDEPEQSEWDELEWTRYHEATHAAVARSLGYSAHAHVGSNGSGWTKVR